MLVKIGGVLTAKISCIWILLIYSMKVIFKKHVYVRVGVGVVCLMCESVVPVHTLACVWRSEDGFLVITLSQLTIEVLGLQTT